MRNPRNLRQRVKDLEERGQHDKHQIKRQSEELSRLKDTLRAIAGIGNPEEKEICLAYLCRKDFDKNVVAEVSRLYEFSCVTPPDAVALRIFTGQESYGYNELASV